MVSLDSVTSWWDGQSRIRKGLIIVILIFLLLWIVSSFDGNDKDVTNSTNTSQTSDNNTFNNSDLSADLNSNLHDTGKMVFEEPGEGWYIKNTDESDYVRYYRDIGKAQIDVMLCYPYGEFHKDQELELNSFEYAGYIGKGNNGNSKIELYKSQLTSVDMYAYVVTEGDKTFIIELTGPAKDVATRIAESIHSK